MAPYLNYIYGLSIFFIGLIGFLSVHCRWKYRANRTLLYFCLSTIGWAITLYLGFHFSIIGNRELATYFIRGTFAFGTLFIFLLSRFIYLFPLKSLPYPKWAERLSLGINLILVGISFFTPLIYKRAAEVVNGEQIGEELGSLYLVSVLYILLNYFFQIQQSIVKIRRSKGVERKKIVLSFVGLFTFLFILVLTNLILPIFEIYIFQQESVFFSFFFLIPTFYAIKKYRFLDIKFTLSKSFIYLIVVLISVFVSLGSFYLFAWLLPDISLIADHTISLIVLFVTYQMLITVARSSFFHKIFDYSNIDFFRNKIREFMSEKKFYGSLKNLKKDLKVLFLDHFQLREVEIYILKLSDYSKLREHFLKDSNFLVTKEVDFFQKEKSGTESYYQELSQLGELCFPLYKSWELDSLFGFFVLGKKNRFDDLYTKEELEILEQLSHYLSIALLGILYNAHLHDEVETKTKEVKDMLIQQSDFITASTHELRTPLAAALFEAQDLVESLKESDALDLTERRKDARSIAESLERLQGITKKIFDVQAYDTKRVKHFPVPTNLDDFSNIIYHKFSPMMKKEKLLWKVESDLPKKFIFTLDPDQIEKMLSELIINAIHFTPSKGSVMFKLSHQNNALNFRVIDTGEGIPKKEKENIFKKFKSNHGMQGMGIGLGLYIVKKIVELHQGEVDINDTPGGGTVFIVRLPRLNDGSV